MESSESKMGRQIPSQWQESETSSQLKPYYHIHSGNQGNSQTEHPSESLLSRADALLQEERQSCVEPMLSLVIPIHNAQGWLPDLLEHLLTLHAEKEIVIVDDGSTDATLPTVANLAARHADITLLRHESTLGQSTAIQTGLAAALGKVVVVLNGITDVENKDIVMLVKPILAGCCDVVYGSHHILLDPDHESRWIRSADRLLTGILNCCTGQHLSSIESPLKAFRREALEDIQLKTYRRSHDVEMIFQLSRKGKRIYEMPLNSPIQHQSPRNSIWKRVVTASRLLRQAMRF